MDAGAISSISPCILKVPGFNSILFLSYWASINFADTFFLSNSSPTRKEKTRFLYSSGSVKPYIEATDATTIVSLLSKTELIADERIISISSFI